MPNINDVYLPSKDITEKIIRIKYNSDSLYYIKAFGHTFRCKYCYDFIFRSLILSMTHMHVLKLICTKHHISSVFIPLEEDYYLRSYNKDNYIFYESKILTI